MLPVLILPRLVGLACENDFVAGGRLDANALDEVAIEVGEHLVAQLVDRVGQAGEGNQIIIRRGEGGRRAVFREARGERLEAEFEHAPGGR